MSAHENLKTIKHDRILWFAIQVFIWARGAHAGLTNEKWNESEIAKSGAKRRE